MAQSIKFVHYWTDTQGKIASAGTQYAPAQVVAAVPDDVANSLIHASIAVSSAAAATSQLPNMDARLTGAGKTTVTDGDFTGITLQDGMMVQVVNTTDSTVRMATRSGGVWKVSAAYT